MGIHVGFLQKHAKVIAFDQDADARCYARGHLAEFGEQVEIVAGNFGDIEELLGQRNISKVDGILADIGVSSWQFDQGDRGFSFFHGWPARYAYEQRCWAYCC